MAVKFRLETTDIKVMKKAGCVWFDGNPYAKDHEDNWVPVNHSTPWNNTMTKEGE